MQRGWRDALQTAADLAIVGFATTFAALPVVTAGGAVLTASRAVEHYLEHDSWPSARECWATFRRSFLPGLTGSLVVAVAAGLLTADLLALSSGRVPGGPGAIAAVATIGLLLAGLVGLALVTGPRAALRAAADRPRLLASAAGVAGVALTLAALIHPVLIPVLLGHTVFALHVLSRAKTASEART